MVTDPCSQLQWDNYAYADKVREKQRRQEAAAIKASLEARQGKRAAEAAPLADAEVLNPKKAKKGKPTQSKPWSAKEDAEAKAKLRREKKLKKLKALQGNIIVHSDGEEEVQDWKEELARAKKAKRAEKSSAPTGTGDHVGFEGL
jgi:ATP-dependent RNA helicase DDX55/SPB4